MSVFQSGWEQYKSFWTKNGFADFKGRISRREFWSFYLVYFLLSLVPVLIDAIFSLGISAIWSVIHIIPYNCHLIKRLHDSNKSGTWVVAYGFLGCGGLTLLFSRGVKIVSNLAQEFITNDFLLDDFLIYSVANKVQGLFVFAGIWLIAVLVMFVILFVFTLLKGDKGVNRYGNDPKDLPNDETKADAIVINAVENKNEIIPLAGGCEMKILKCGKCGKVICVLSDSSNPDIYCCGVVMSALKANTVDAAVEKHVPVVEQNGNAVMVRIGSVSHPMTFEHHIGWIMLEGSKTVQFADVKNCQSAEALFALPEGEEIKNAYAYCNLHGLWSLK